MRTTKALIRLRDAQADLSLRWAHMSEGTFSHVEAHMDINCANNIKSLMLYLVFESL